MSKRTIAALGLTVLLYAVPSSAAPVIREGREWLQPADFTNLSWNQVEAVCPLPSGLCAGSLNGIDVTGYTWASVDDMNALFNSYIGAPELGPGPDEFFQQNSTWAPMFFVDFEPTIDNAFIQSTLCFTQTDDNISEAYIAELYDNTNSTIADLAWTTQVVDKAGYLSTFVGSCFYRTLPPEPHAVPTTPTYMLILTMLGLLGIASGRHLRRKSKVG